MGADIPATLASDGKLISMYARVTAKDQITVPEAALAEFSGIEHFRITCEEGRIVLIPLAGSSGDKVRSKLKALGITEQDVADAVAWARGH